ncbi:hypothetical protein [Sphingomonas sp. GB1N7]|uniref:hypothetical protein n=1 Tax=Parasphingomonas caseinilytica TaxID=3096158 RepID=UPI002FC6057A
MKILLVALAVILAVAIFFFIGAVQRELNERARATRRRKRAQDLIYFEEAGEIE